MLLVDSVEAFNKAIVNRGKQLLVTTRRAVWKNITLLNLVIYHEWLKTKTDTNEAASLALMETKIDELFLACVDTQATKSNKVKSSKVVQLATPSKTKKVHGNKRGSTGPILPAKDDSIRKYPGFYLVLMLHKVCYGRDEPAELKTDRYYGAALKSRW
jgi:hypothetical protein